jgi:hypothetical protein
MTPAGSTPAAKPGAAMVIKNGVDVRATYATSGRASMAITVKVDDDAVRRQADGFDGMERPFALVPREVNGQVQWNRVDLGYLGSRLESPNGRKIVDEYMSTGMLDPAAARKYGIAVGLDTNVGTLWLQEPGKNIPVKPCDQP